MKNTKMTTIACLLGMVTFAVPTFAVDASTEQRAIIKTMVGQVEVSLPKTTQWRPARIGMVVKMGSDIRTYVESGLDIELESGTVIKVGENTVVSMAKLLQNKATDVSNTSMKVGTGKVWANVKKLTNTKSEFNFETPTAVASIRGTRLGVSVDLHGTSVDVYEGLVMVREKSSGKTVSVATNSSAIVHAGSKGIDMVDFSKKSPSDTAKMKADPFAAGDTGLAKAKQDSLAAKARADTAAAHRKPDTLQNKQTGLFIKVSSPKEGLVVSDPMIPVAGTTAPGAKVLVNNTSITVSASGAFSYTVPIPDEAHDYNIHIVARLGDNEANEDRTVSYQPSKTPLTLTISSPADGQVIKENVIRVTGKTSPRATVTVNGRPAVVSPQGAITYESQLTERDIGDYELDIVASDETKEMTKTVRVTVDITSPQINISFPILVVQEQSLQATRTGKLTVDVLDRTPEDQISLEFLNNGRTDNITMTPGERQYLNLDEGKNAYTVKAYDKARNMSNVVQGVIYYLPGHLVIQIREPVDNPMVIEDMPPMPRNVAASQLRVEVEIEDEIGNVPETIKYCRLVGEGKTLQMLGNNNYRYYTNVPLSFGSHTYMVQVEDIVGNLMTKRLDMVVKR
jgi:Uncharacterized protein conserved in bacteria